MAYKVVVKHHSAHGLGLANLYRVLPVSKRVKHEMESLRN